MNIPEEFGNYLLLKKLREDALGESFRAGKVGQEGIEQVVLLRVFNGQGMDGERLWQRTSGRAALQQALRSPNIGTGVDLGKVRSFPYAAYDYVSGKNLATLFAQAMRQHQPLPVDHALLIAERMALALAAAYETRVGDERVLHGFVVPHLVMISNEGEARLLGFEVAPGLRELWSGGWHDDDLRAYLAPEATASAAIGKSDDVYSLGAVLFELLAGERLTVMPPAGGYAAAIDAMVLPNEGTPLPAGIAALLKKSLVPREQRIPDALTWHKTVSKLMIEGHYGSTTFNLAFFMHSLFRDEIDRENQEMEAEKKLELPRRTAGAVAAASATGAVAAATAAAAAGAAGDMRERTGVRDATWAGSARAAAPPPAANRKPLFIGIAVAAAAVIAAGSWFAFGRSNAAPKPAMQPAPAAAAAAPTAEEAARTAAALQAQIQQMIEARSKDMESKLKGQYDDQIHQLQQKLEESRRVAATESDREKARGDRAAPAAAAEAAQLPAPAHTSDAAPAPARTNPAPVPAPAPAREASAVPASAAAAVPPPAAAPAPEPAAASQPQIQVGDLVQGGPGVVVPRVTYRPEVRFPTAARRMNKSAEVLVRVLVDERGRVQQTALQNAPVGLGFDEAALDVARRSNYQPATKDGVRVKMWTVMKVTFVPPV